jgi:hypothetical protein
MTASVDLPCTPPIHYSFASVCIRLSVAVPQTPQLRELLLSGGLSTSEIRLKASAGRITVKRNCNGLQNLVMSSRRFGMKMQAYLRVRD